MKLEAIRNKLRAAERKRYDAARKLQKGGEYFKPHLGL